MAEKLAHLRAIRDDLKAEIEAHMAHLPETAALRHVEAQIASLENPAAALSEADIPLPYGGSSHAALTTLALHAIAEGEAPMRTDEVFALLRKLHHVADTKEALASLVSALSRDTRFARVTWRDQNAWWPAGRALP